MIIQPIKPPRQRQLEAAVCACVLLKAREFAQLREVTAPSVDDKAERKSRFIRRVDAIQASLGRLDRKTARETYGLIKEMRQRLLSELATIPRDDGKWRPYHLEQLEAATRDVMTQFHERYGHFLPDAQEEGWNLGEDVNRSMLQDFEARFTTPLGIDITKMEIAQQYSMDLVDDITEFTRGKINTELKMAVLGEKSAWEAVQAIGGPNGYLEDPSVFRSTRVRAETQVRTEVLRMHSIAGQETLKKAGEVIDDLQKQWWTAGDERVRPAHAAANGQYVDYDKPFIVGGEALMYPRDPAGSAENTIQCRCSSVPYKTDWPDL